MAARRRSGAAGTGGGGHPFALPFSLPIEPMLAALTREIPAGDFWYEPKWDGFRALLARDGAHFEIWSRQQRPLGRYFPELLAALPGQLPERCVVDGEIVIAAATGLDFDALLQRIHPAASRIATLARRTPASFVAFDLLALGDEDLRERPFAERRRALDRALARSTAPLFVTPGSDSLAVARDWFTRFEGAGLDGVIAKPRGLPYRGGRREMIKVKHERTADCVVGGYRVHQDGRGVGSLLLGLFDEQGVLHHIGVASGFAAAQRRALLHELEPLRTDRDHPWLGVEEGEGSARLPGGESRWTGGRDASWIAVRPERTAEVRYDHMQGDRFRHATRFLRWRPDRDPASCTYAQLETVVPAELGGLFRARPRS